MINLRILKAMFLRGCHWFILEEKLIKPNHLDRKYAAIVNKFYFLQKKIMHREIREIKGAYLDTLFKEAQDFVEKIDDFINKRFKTRKPKRF